MEFTKKTSLKASAKEIYTAWLDSKGHTEMTGGKAVCSAETGGNFHAWDGYIEGTNLILIPYTRIVQSWRTSQFHDNDPDSRIELTFTEIHGHTEVILNHTNVPEGGEHYISGWDQHYFEPMKRYFDRQ